MVLIQRGAHVNGWWGELISPPVSPLALFFLSLALSFPSPVPVTAGKGLLLAFGPISQGLKRKAC